MKRPLGEAYDDKYTPLVLRQIAKKRTFVQRAKSFDKTRDYSSQLTAKVVPLPVKTTTPSAATTDSRKKVKSLSDYKRCPDRIRCGDEVIPNHERPICIARGLDFEKSYQIGDHYHEHFLSLMGEFGKDRPIIGCMAWFTDTDMIATLAKACKIMVIINDENYSSWGNGVVTKEKYAPLPAFGTTPFSNYWGHIKSALNFKALQGKEWEAVRCYGQKCIIERENEDLKKGGNALIKHSNFMTPIMHAKYLIISEKVRENGRTVYMPRWIWQGSMNLTKNSSNNIELCYFIDNRVWALDLFFKFANTFMSSSPVRY